MIVRTPKLNDDDLLGIIEKLFDFFPEGSASVALANAVNRSFSDVDEIADYEFDRTQRNIQSFLFQCQSSEPDTVVFQRGVIDTDYARQQGDQTAFAKRIPSAYYDELAFFPPRSRTGNYQVLADDKKVTVSELLGSFAAPTDVSSDEEARKLSKVVSKQINDLRKLNLDMTAGLAEARQKDQQDFTQRQKDLDDSFAERLQQLTIKEGELEQRRKELNDREPQHERRRLREHLTDQLRTVIAEPRIETQKNERSSSYFYILAGIFFVAVSIFFAMNADIKLTAGSAAFWAQTLKSFASGVAGAAFGWAGLSGLKAAALAAREYEQNVQRYAFDMDRASWVVETILQMNAIEKANVPDEWLEAVCRDLFSIGGKGSEETKPLEAFAALFDATAKARLGTNGLEFEIDRKGAKKLAE